MNVQHENNYMQQNFNKGETVMKTNNSVNSVTRKIFGL